MILEDITKLTRQSHKKILVSCDEQCSPKCTKTHLSEYRDCMDTMDRNGGKYICIFCSRHIKNMGRYNPNTKYSINDSMFEIVDTKEKAYLLGWIASDGTIKKSGFSISIHEKDEDILCELRRIIGCEAVPVVHRGDRFVNITINSQEIAGDLCRLLQILPGKKDRVVKFPDLNPELSLAFIRGYFDGDGSVSDPRTNEKNSPRCSIGSNSHSMLQSIFDFMKVPGSITKIAIDYSGNNALDFLGKMYADKNFPSLYRKYELFLLWSVWESSLSGYDSGSRIPGAKWAKTRKDAVPPTKVRVSDSGYDLTLIEKISDDGFIQLYETGIKIKPDFGWYFMVVPRSSIIKSGYILANSVGIIDRTYTGTIKIPLLKMKGEKELELPCRLVQIIPQKIVHFEIKEVTPKEIENTERSENGFGSSDVMPVETPVIREVDSEEFNKVKSERGATGGILRQVNVAEWTEIDDNGLPKPSKPDITKYNGVDMSYWKAKYE
jgi:deoxyuridine 5'-triphosphate nucleotidohydrolase